MKARGVVKEEAPLVVVVWMAAGFESSEMTKLLLILLAFEKARKTERTEVLANIGESGETFNVKLFSHCTAEFANYGTDGPRS